MHYTKSEHLPYWFAAVAFTLSAASMSACLAGQTSTFAADTAAVDDLQPTAEPTAGPVHPTASKGPDPTPGAPSLTIFGRYVTPDANDPNHLRLGWSGASVGATFKASSVVAHMIDTDNYAPVQHHNYYDVVLDGTVVQTFQMKAFVDRYTLVTNVPPGEHVLWLVKRTEGVLAGTTEFYGLELDSTGTLLAGPAHRTRRLQVVGASNDTAFGALASLVAPANCPGIQNYDNVLQLQDSSIGWNQLAADALGAEVHNVSFCGVGLILGEYSANAADVYERADPIDSALQWNHAKYVPDAVFLDLGNMDYIKGVRNSDALTQKYVTLAKHIATLYPKARIYVIVSASLQSDQRAFAKTYVTATVNSMNTQGYPQVVELEMPQYMGNVWGCDGHWTKDLHAEMGKFVTDLLRKDLGW